MEKNTTTPLLNSLVKGGSISLVGQVSLTAFNLIFQFYLARVLGAAGLGVYTLGFAITNLAMYVALMGLDRGIIKFVAHYTTLGEHEKAKGVLVTTFRTYLLSSLAIGFLLGIGADYIANQIYHEPALTQVLRLMTINMIVTGYIILLVNIPLAFRHTEYQAIYSQIVKPALKLALSLILVFLVGRMVMSFVYATVLSAVLSGLAVLWTVARFEPFRDIIKHKTILDRKALFTFSGPLFLTQLLQRSEGQLSFLLLGYMAMMSDVGIYRIGSRLIIPMTMILLALNTIFSPIISSLYAKNRIQDLETLYQTTSRWMIIMVLPSFIFLIILDRELLNLFGEEFVLARTVLRLLAVAQLVNVTTGSVGLILQMTKYVWVNFFNALLTLALMFVLAIALIPDYGILGAGIAEMCAVIILNILRLVQVYILLHIHPFDVYLIKPIFAAGITWFLVSRLNQWINFLSDIPQILILGSAIAIIYFSFIWLMRLNSTDRQMIGMIVKRVTGKEMPLSKRVQRY